MVSVLDLVKRLILRDIELEPGQASMPTNNPFHKAYPLLPRG